MLAEQGVIPAGNPDQAEARMPLLQLMNSQMVDRVVQEAFEILETIGVEVQDAEAARLLGENGARPDKNRRRVCLPEALVRKALATVPSSFELYAADGTPAVHYGEDRVHFDPGSSAVHVLDGATHEHRNALTQDLVDLVKVADMLPEYAAQSTAVNCADVPTAIGDMYRLYLVLLHSPKPVVTGAFGLPTLGRMRDMLLAVAADTPQARQRAVFDVCPSPPLKWTGFAAGNLLFLARERIPAEIISMPLAGATAPATLAGSIVQHAAETLAGITLHQLAGPGAPIVWGGAPAIFDMRYGTTPMGAIETAMMDAAYAQVGKHLGLPTHTYLGATDAKTIDAQAGLESGMTALVGAMAGINMISGAGMLDFLASQSIEKLVLDAEGIAMAQRLLQGISARDATLAKDVFAQLGPDLDFLGLRHTRQNFKLEQHLPTSVIDRASIRSWKESGQLTAFDRARERGLELLRRHTRPTLAASAERDLTSIVTTAAREAGMTTLPSFH
jgi:trimethylamine--corrinoid protein Co-methyltransferase